MVQFNPYLTPSGLIGQAFGQGIQQAGQRYMLQNALQGLEGLANKPGTSPFQLLSTLISSTSGIPGAEKYIGPVFQSLLPMLNQRAEQAAGSPLGSMQGTSTTPLSSTSMQTPVLPSIPETSKSTKPKEIQNEIEPIPGMGNFPQDPTSGVMRPILNADQEWAQAAKYQQDLKNAGKFISINEAYKDVHGLNTQNEAYNKSVEDTRKLRIEEQQRYGNLAQNELQKQFGKDEIINPEITAYFRRKGEEAADAKRSEAEIQAEVAKEARIFKNSIANIRKDIGAERSYNTYYRRFAGTHREFEQAADDVRIHLKPLLDKGFYDTARKELSSPKIGYYPEEIEQIINKPADNLQKYYNSLPISGILGGYEIEGKVDITPQQRSKLENKIQDAFRIDPNASIVLMRKNFEDKGYNWRIFKDSITKLVKDEKIKLNPDQIIQMGILDTPPLIGLDKSLEGMGIIGR